MGLTVCPLYLLARASVGPEQCPPPRGGARRMCTGGSLPTPSPKGTGSPRRPAPWGTNAPIRGAISRTGPVGTAATAPTPSVGSNTPVAGGTPPLSAAMPGRGIGGLCVPRGTSALMRAARPHTHRARAATSVGTSSAGFSTPVGDGTHPSCRPHPPCQWPVLQEAHQMQWLGRRRTSQRQYCPSTAHYCCSASPLWRQSGSLPDSP